MLATRRFRSQPVHKAHNRETLSDTEQLASTGPSPHRLHHLDMHAIRRMEKSTHRDPFSWPLFCFGFGGGFPKVWHPKPQLGSVLLAADSHLGGKKKKRTVLSELLGYKAKPWRHAPADTCTSFQPCGSQPGWNIVSASRLIFTPV